MINNYYKKNKVKLSKRAREKYQNLSEEKKGKRRQDARERYRNFSEEEKEKKSVSMVVNDLKIFYRM